MYNSWTKAADIQDWAQKTSARSLLPALIRRLIWATAKPTEEFSFPAGEEIQRPSWDGRLTVDQGNVWVPENRSFWEISVGKPPTDKATENYNKRTKGTTPSEAADRTFVFVTPLKWTGKQKWSDKRKKENKWKDVRVLDSDDLEHWIEIAPAVDIWIAQLIGKRPSGVQDLSSRWRGIAAQTQPPLPPGAFLAGREKTKADLSEALSGAPCDIPISASSEQELIDFAAAAYGSLEDNDSLPARCVIVETSDAWSTFLSGGERQVLMPAPGLVVSRTSIASAIAAGNHVITHRTYSSLHQPGIIKLPRAWRFEIGTALAKAGFPEERAHRLSRECGGYLTSLQRLAVPGSSNDIPAWARDGEGARFVPFILIGSWDDAQAGDRNIVSDLTEMEYEKAAKFAAGWITKPDSPFRRSGREWHLASREDSWIHIAPRLTRDQLERFTSLAISVLSEDDPRFEMKPDERVFASIKDKMPRHSSILRKGLAETFALLGAGLVPLPALPASDGVSFALRAVRELLSRANTTQRWFTLSPILTLLAEAAPDEFMDAVERDLALVQPTLARLLAEDDSGIFGGNRHHYMMWALTSLAWHPAYLTRSALALARLAELDPGGRMGPRPAGSLHDIFRPWMPQTAVGSSQRFDVIDRLAEVNPNVAWTLLIKLLPKEYDSTSGTTAPRWREWPASKRAVVTNNEIFEQREWTGQRLLIMATQNARRLEELIGEIDRLLDAQFTLLVFHLLSDDVINLPREDRLRIWKKLQNLVRKHEYFHTSHWRMSDERLTRIKEVETHLRPAAPSEHSRWLFENYDLQIGKYKETSSDEEDSIALELRKKLVSDLYEQGGVQAVAAFCEDLQYPGLVGRILALALPTMLPDEVIPRYLGDDNPNVVVFGKCFAAAVFVDRDWDWVESLPLGTWSPKSATAFILALPETQRAWALAKSLGHEVEGAYWNQVFPYPRNMDAEDCAHVVRRLLEHNRALIAANFSVSVYFNRLMLPADLLSEILEQSVSAINDAAETENNLSHTIYELGELLGYLQSASDNDPRRVAQLEWIYLPLMKSGNGFPKFLQEELGHDPASFVHCVELIYRRNDEEHDSCSGSEIDVSKSRIANELLDSWSTHPAVLGDDGPNELALRTWVEAVRLGCSNSGRGDSGDYQIGRLLASSPTESDGTWPCIAVRNVLEAIPGNVALRAFRTTIFKALFQMCRSDSCLSLR